MIIILIIRFPPGISKSAVTSFLCFSAVKWIYTPTACQLSSTLVNAANDSEQANTMTVLIRASGYNVFRTLVFDKYINVHWRVTGTPDLHIRPLLEGSRVTSQALLSFCGPYLVDFL